MNESSKYNLNYANLSKQTIPNHFFLRAIDCLAFQGRAQEIKFGLSVLSLLFFSLIKVKGKRNYRVFWGGNTNDLRREKAKEMRTEKNQEREREKIETANRIGNGRGKGQGF